MRREGGADLRIEDPDALADHVVDGVLTAALLLSAGEPVSRGVAPKLGSLSVPGLAVAGATWLRYRAIPARRTGAPTAAARVRLARRVIRSARRSPQP